MLHLQRRTLDAVGAARLRSGVGHVETVGVMDGYGSYPYYSSTKIRKLHLCYAKNVHQPWPLALKFPEPEVEPRRAAVAPLSQRRDRQA